MRPCYLNIQLDDNDDDCVDDDDDFFFTEMHGCSLSDYEYLRAPISE